MAINWTSESILSGRIAPPSSSYPYGTYRDKSTSASNDGTPIAKALIWKDFHGFFQYLLVNGKRGPSDSSPVTGNPDTATVSDYASALYNTHRSDGYAAYSPSETTPTGGTLAHSYLRYNGVYNFKGVGSSYNISSALTNGGITFGGTTPGASCTMRRNTVPTTPSNWIISSSTPNTIYSIVDITVNGLKYTGNKIQMVTLNMYNSGTDGQLSTPIFCRIEPDANDDIVLTYARGFFVGAAPWSADSADLVIDYNPTVID